MDPLNIAFVLTLYFLHLTFFAPGNLVDWQIKFYSLIGLLKIDNMRKEAIQPNSLDVHLGRFFAQQNKDGSFESSEADEIVLNPGEFVLATTEEFFRFPSTLHGVLQGKSSWARLGLYVESAGLFDSGFDGEAVVELTNQGKAPLTLRAGKAIAQMIFIRNLPVKHKYGKKGHYQGQKGARQSWFNDVVSKTEKKITENSPFISKEDSKLEV
jgi:dCTP deaminase